MKTHAGARLFRAEFQRISREPASSSSRWIGQIGALYERDYR